MKARVRATGKIVEARRIGQSSQGTLWEAEGSNYYQYELDFNMKEPPKPPYDPDYWTRLEHQYAGMFMKSFLDNFDGTTSITQLLDSAMDLAHALVQKIKEMEERK